MNLVSQNFSDLREPNIQMKKFPDGDNYICLPPITEKKAVVFHRLYPEQDTALIQAVLILDTLKRKGVSATLVSPYLPYARQDKVFKEGEALSAEVIASILHHAGAKKLITIDCHFIKKEGSVEYGGLEILNLSANRLLIQHARNLVGEVEVISPDVGASYLVESFGGKSMKKTRGEYISGVTAYRKIEKMEMAFDVHGKNILILDDMISTGSTMLKAVENVKKGGAKKVLCAATHGLFLGDCLKKLQAVCDHVFVTDSIPSFVSAVSIKPLLNPFLSD
ncbi:MAG: ribose-phosphate diphosphokinase [Candidatus Bilamarchaeaceae archaeon]